MSGVKKYYQRFGYEWRKKGDKISTAGTCHTIAGTGTYVIP